MSVFKRFNGTTWETIGPGITYNNMSLIEDLIAPEYSPTATYAVGDHVVQNDKLYRCKTAITVAEIWTAAHWTEVKVGNEVSDVKNTLNTANNYQAIYGKNELSMPYIADKIVYKTGVTIDYPGGMMSNPIMLYPGQFIHCTNISGNGNFALISTCDEDGTEISVVHTGNSSGSMFELKYLNRTDSIIYVIISSVYSNSTTIKVSDPNILDYYQLKNKRTNRLMLPCEYEFLSMFIGSNLAVMQTSIDSTSTLSTIPIFVEKGERVIVTGRVGTNICMVAKTNKVGGIISSLCTGTGSNKVYSFIADEDMYIIVTVLRTYSYSIVKECACNIPEIGVNNFNLIRPVVSFIFDDGNTTDANAVAAFDAHNLKCTFALTSDLAPNKERMNEYLYYQSKGHEVLSHSTDGRTMSGYGSADIQDESVAVQCMHDSKNTLIDNGFNIFGWVTPSGRLNPSWIHDVKDYYDYGFVIPNIPYTDQATQTPYFTRDISAFSGFRVSLEESTVAMCKDAIDRAISNKGMVVFYGHQVQETSTNYLTISSLNEILDYVVSKRNDIICLPCNTAMRYFFKRTHEDDIS